MNLLVHMYALVKRNANTGTHTHSALSEQFISSVAISKGSILNTG